MPRFRIPVSKKLVAYALETYEDYVPRGRYSGFADEGKRGRGDFYDLVATLGLHHFFADEGYACSAQLVVGGGDNGTDLSFHHAGTGKLLRVNVKTSRASHSSGLHLIVKAEEMEEHRNPADIYLQVLAHVGKLDQTGYEPDRGEPDASGVLQPMDPTLVVLGWCFRGDERWQRGKQGAIPETGGHPGVLIEEDTLLPIGQLLAIMTRRI